MGPAAKPSGKTIADWLAQPDSAHFELIDGELTEKAAPSIDHGVVQLSVGSQIRSRFHRRPGGRFPGGWWIASEVDIQLGTNIFRPDLCGWKRERLPELPKERPVKVRPDWICEIVSDSDAARDRVVKLRAYHQASVPHYWLIEPSSRTLTVLRHTEGGYLTVLAASADEKVRAEPFDAVELLVASFFDDEPDDAAP
jgi:Uma2 family endonuclease